MMTFDRSTTERGATLVMALLTTALLLALGAAVAMMSVSENNIARNDEWSEGAFFAAEAGSQAAIDQLTVDPATSTDAIPVTGISASYTYRSGGLGDTAPQPLQFLGSEPEPGFSIGSGTGYNASGYTFRVYQVNATGTGPRNARREVETQVELGPVSQ